jgi:transcriptional regulator with GAF, ATPase, and Fis domain
LLNLGSRRDRAFVRMNCAAIASGLLESELFGQDKGEFTGANFVRARLSAALTQPTVESTSSAISSCE